ncbi:MAG TPA: alpha/beta hydrolase [Candidatus Krumholzibacteria bacterium]|nr:alpha/beta hydrolase [Candidatus Krumholzibacteria bacterium]
MTLRARALVPLLLLLALTAAGCGRAVHVGEARSADGVPIAFEAHGRGEPALVFVHGWSCDRGYWKEQVDAFAADHRVVLLDLAGHGASGVDRAAWTMDAYGADVAAVCDLLDLEKVILIGHSMGGTVIAEAGRLLGDRLVGLIGVDTLHDVEEHLTPEQIAGFTAPMDANFPVTMKAFVRSMFTASADSATVARIADDMAAAPPRVAVPTLRNYLAWDLPATLDAYRPRVRCINADLWPTTPAHGRNHCAEFEVEIIPDAGHFLMLEMPDVFNAALRRAVESLES